MKLAADGWTLEARPELGGAITALRWLNRDVLRATPPDTQHVLATSCFPLVPYANRIAHGRFMDEGQTRRLPLNFGDHPHSLHGLGWQVPWTVIHADEHSATLVHQHDGGTGWPWRYRAEQRFALSTAGATIELSLTNLDDRAMPWGLGLHPYFPAQSQTNLAFTAERMWLSDSTMLPTEPVDAAHFGDWSIRHAVAGDSLIDNAFDGWDGAVRIGQPWGKVMLTATGAPVLHLFRPPGERFFCAEPVSHLPDAINRAGLPQLPPGETRTMTMAIRTG